MPSVRAKVLRVTPGSKNPSFTEVASLKIITQEAALDPPLIRGNHVILSSKQSLVLWDYAGARAASWKTPHVTALSPMPNVRHYPFTSRNVSYVNLDIRRCAFQIRDFSSVARGALWWDGAYRRQSSK